MSATTTRTRQVSQHGRSGWFILLCLWFSYRPLDARCQNVIWSEDFTSGYPLFQQDIQQNGPAGSRWIVSSSAGHPHPCMHIAPVNDTTWQAIGTGPVHAWFDLAIPDTAVSIELSYAAHGISACGSLSRVWVVPVSFTPTMNQCITETGQTLDGRYQLGPDISVAGWAPFRHVLASFHGGHTLRLVFEWRNGLPMGPPMAVDDLSLTVSTCSSPIGLQLTQATSTSAALAWATDVEGSYAVEARNAYQYDPFVPGFLVGSGSTDSGFHSISGLLTGMRSYTASVRRTCVNGSFSVWCEPVPFSTAPGCDGALLSLEAEEYLLEGADHSRVICPGVQGEAVTVTTLSFMADEPMTVFNGPGEDSPVLGIYTGNVSDEVLSSTDYSGCLTFQNIPMSVYVTTYLQASVSCGPKEHLVPWGLSATDISDHGALVQWNCLGCDDYSAYVEYGPIGFAPGQGMIAGDGTVLVSDSGSVRLNGLSSGTAYEVCVRAGSGPWDWSGDGPVPFTTTGSGTGIDEEGTAIIRLAPNPASDLVEVWIAGDDQRIDLIDAQGRTCRSLALPTGIERQQRIQLSDLPTGVYIVAIFGNDERRSAFLIKY